MHENFVLSMLVLWSMIIVGYKILRIRADWIIKAQYGDYSYYNDGSSKDPRDLNNRDWVRFVCAERNCRTKFWHKKWGAWMEWDQL